jgi:pimeloyl-ACP methyl ester carboxylesterase
MRPFNNLSLRVFFPIIALFFFISCTNSDDENITGNQKLISAEKIALRTPKEAKFFAESQGLDSLSKYLTENSDIYRITYKTLYKKNDITASGIVCIPRKDEAMDVLCFQHGTIAAHDEAPSIDVGVGGSSYGNLQYLSCAGLIVAFPDQIGFGSSTQILHPYYVKDPSSQAILDMISATREHALNKGKSMSGKLYLAGYSQGGYLTLAAHREMQFRSVPTGFTHTASYAASGGYLVKGVQEFFFSQTTYGQPFYMGYVSLAYKNYYDWSSPMSIFFQEPYASKMPSLFNGTLSGDMINDSLTSVVADLLEPNFLANIDTDPKYTDLLNAFEENSLVDFVPDVHLVLYHGDQDITVPYQNTVDAFAKFNSLGAGPNLVFVTLNGADHGSGFIPYLKDFLGRMGYN